MNVNDHFVMMLVEDSTDDTRLMEGVVAGLDRDKLGGREIELCRFDSLDGARERLNDGTDWDIVILNLSLGGSGGNETLEKFRHVFFDLPVIVLTALRDEAIALYALKLGAQDYLIKGEISSDILARSVRYSMERHKLITDLRSLSLIDELTGLYNRRGFTTLSENFLRLCDRTSEPGAVFFIDLDHMKSINDDFGHAMGDRALLDVADIMRRTFRLSDLTARLGGDEFVAFTMHSNESDVVKILQRLRGIIETRNRETENPFSISLSVGVAPYVPGSAQSIETLLVKADKLMYEDKSTRRRID